MTYDIIVIGGGPAGLTAALYARRANKQVLVIEKATFGGQITYSPKVENIPGFLELSGNEFAEKLVDQVLAQGADVESCEVLEIEDGPVKIVRTDSGDFTGRSIIIATGAKHRMLGLPGEENYVGNGISFCAVCDGAFYRGKCVGVVGGGNSALQEALLLSELAKEVYVIQNLDFLTGEQQLQMQLRAKSNVHIVLGTVVDGFHGEGELTGVRIKTVSDGACSDLWLDGLFVAIGLIPQNDAFANVLELDERGYAKVDEGCCAGTPGVFVAGDCRAKRIRQVATAAADGAIAALAACDYVDALNK
jgi:thioredoxin reductase (NADPH)